MTRPIEHDPETGLMRMLREALRAGLAPAADDEAFVMARSSAQLIGLMALDSALGALDPFRGRPWQGPAFELVEFVERLMAENDLNAFRAAEPDFALRAEALAHWRAPVTTGEEPPAAPPDPAPGADAAPDAAEAELPAAIPPEGSVLVEDALAELPLSGDAATARATRAWLTAPVAAGLRAALEWLVSDPEHPRPFRLRAEDSVLEVQCDAVRPEGLAPAHEVLAEAGGNLAPLGEVSARAIAGSWMVRVAAWSPRPVHLMLEQGDLRLALPWHSVLRLSLVPSIEIEMREGSLSTRVLPPLAQLHGSTGERPVVAIANGLKRGLVVADRLVWRLGAEPCEPDGPPPVAGLRDTVRSVEGEAYWVADPAMLLARVPVPPLPGDRGPRDTGPAPRETTPVEPRRSPEPIEPAVLDAANVEALELTLGDVEPLPAAAGPAVVAPVADQAAEAPVEAHIVTDAVEAPPEVTEAVEVPLETSEVPAAPITVETPAETTEAPVASDDVETPAQVSDAPAAADGVETPAEISETPASAGAVETPSEVIEARSTSDAIESREEPTESPAPAGDAVEAAPEPDTPVAPSGERKVPDWIARFGSTGVSGQPAPEPPAPRPRVPAATVLLVEDSFVARHFLTRLFERRGLRVIGVDSAAAARAELGSRRWSLVCADVDLPDAAAGEFVVELSQALEALEVPLVALVRDDEDADRVEGAGVRRWLRKPFDFDDVDRLLSRLGLLEETR